MTSAAEAAGAKPAFASDLAIGIDALSNGGAVTFTKYVKLVLPLDGYVFWVRADLLSQSALLNASRFNGSPFNVNPKVVTSAPTLTVKGSLHYSSDKQQLEDESASKNSIVFSATEQVNDLDAVSPTVMFIAYINGDPYAFSTQGYYYQQANLYHYTGDALNPAVQTQVVNDLAAFNSRNLIVSNSLPIWLGLNQYQPPYPGFVTNVMLYPSFLVPDNLQPPYGVVHIDPVGTIGIQGAPFLGPTLSHEQLSRERVRITTYGLNNDAAQTLLDAIYQYSYDYGTIGLTGVTPVIRDEKRTQRELGILAMKKTIEIEVNYRQTAARQIARQLIESCVQTYLPQNAIVAA